MSKITEKLTDFELCNHDVKNYLLRNISDETSKSWDLNAPYQRDPCWSTSNKKALIRSILANIPIGSIHVVEKNPNSGFYYVLDAKQRLSTIKSFMENEFSVLWNGREFKYSDFQLDENRHLMSKFLDHQTSVVKWEYMPLLKQRTLFEVINQQTPLNSNERIYCPRFFARLLMHYIYKTCFNDIKNQARSEVANNKRYGGDAWVHKICLLCYGDELNDVFGIRQLSKVKMEDSASKLDEKLCVYFSDQMETGVFTDASITSDVINYLGIKDNLQRLKSLNSEILRCINYYQELEKKIDSVTLMDIISFTMEKIQSNILTISQISENRLVFHKLFSKYQIEKEKNNYAKHTTDTTSIKNRKDLFNNLYENFNIDQSAKNKSVPIHERSVALMNAQSNCPISNIALNNENVVIDHVNPKSKYGDTKFCAVSDAGNLLKSNITQNNAKSISNYINEQQKIY